MEKRKKIAFVLGIRPDIIRAALILKYLKQSSSVETLLVWSGQHYSDNLKDIFFRELGIPKPDYELGCKGETDAEICASLISRLYGLFAEIKPDVCVFLGDTNTTTGSIACMQLNIPIIHIEGCMRSYDWTMPEEKYRTMIDHVSDVIYAYFAEYKQQGINEGLNPNNIVVVDNPIVDILNAFYFSKKEKFDAMADDQFFKSRNLEKGNYYTMTCHRRENVHDKVAMDNILKLVAAAGKPVYFPASYRTQKILKEENYTIPKNLILVDPVGYEELLCLMVSSKGVITDSGTLVEESCVLGVPCIQMRQSTERPQVYDVHSAVKFNPRATTELKHDEFIKKLNSLVGTKWKHPFGDGKTSERIANDLIKRAESGTFRGHKKEQYHFPVERSYTNDSIKL